MSTVTASLESKSGQELTRQLSTVKYITDLQVSNYSLVSISPVSPHLTLPIEVSLLHVTRLCLPVRYIQYSIRLFPKFIAFS